MNFKTPKKIEKVFTLVQHTPMIHFQAHAGATLRHDEFKAKFDKYLYKEVEASRKYIVPNDQNNKGEMNVYALDYTVDIEAVNKATPTIIAEGDTRNRPPMFFGNMGDEYIGNEKHTTVLTDVTLTIKSLKTDLLGIIETNLAAFLQQTNFGTRQSKGYGCFMLKDAELDWKGWYSLEGSSDWRATMGNIEDFYKVLRSGMNGVNRAGTSGYYCKPIIFDFTKDKLQWEKKTIKERFFNNALSSQQTRHFTSEALHVKHKDKKNEVIKDLLGFATEERWTDRNATIYKKIEGVDRMKSPILFKPIKEGKDYKVYFRCGEIPIKGKEMKITPYKNGTSNLFLKVYTARPDFFEKLMSHAMSINWDTYMETYNGNGNKQRTEMKELFEKLKIN